MTNPWVVIPTYNEKENIEQLITQLFQLSIPNLSVLIVDDNSPDGTADIVRKFQSQYSSLHLTVREKKSGLGKAYVHGFTYALEKNADAIVQMDADFSHDPKDVPELLAELSEYDLVLGSRYSHGISVINWPLSRLLISIAGNYYARLVTGMPIKDATGGYKAWRASALKAINIEKLDAEGYGFQVVTNYNAWKKNLKIKEVPIIFTERREGKSKMSRGIVLEALWLVWKIRLFG